MLVCIKTISLRAYLRLLSFHSHVQLNGFIPLNTQFSTPQQDEQCPYSGWVACRHNNTASRASFISTRSSQNGWAVIPSQRISMSALYAKHDRSLFMNKLIDANSSYPCALCTLLGSLISQPYYASAAPLHT